MPESTAQLTKRLAALGTVRRAFRDCMTDPLRHALNLRTPLATAATVHELPLELASAGFRLTTQQDATGWHLRLFRQVDEETALRAEGDAKSLLAAMTQLIASTNAQLDALESDVRHELNGDTPVAA